MEHKLLELSDSKVKVIVNILRVISDEDREYSLDYISSYIHLSTRSVQRYLNLLDEVIIDYKQEKGSHFDMKQDSKGVHLIIDKNANINFLVSYLLQKDDTIKLLLALLTQDFPSFSAYSNENFIGTYSINKSIDAINVLLADFELEVDKKNFTIIGSEVNIRFFMHNVFWLVYRCDSFPEQFNVINLNQLKEDIDYIIENLNISPNNPIKEKDMMFRISISLLRYPKKCFVHLDDEMKQNVPIYQNNYGNPTFYETIEHVLNKHHIFDTEEIYFLILSLLNNNLMYTSKTINKQLLKHHQRLNTNVLKSTTLFLEKFQEKIYEIPNEKLDVVYEFIFRVHLISSIQSQQFNDYNSYIFDEARLQFPEYIDQLKKILHEIQEEHQMDLFKNENFLLNRYIMLKYFLNLKLLYKRPIKIKLHTDFPDIYEDYIKSYLENYFKNDYKILFVENDTYQEHDLVLTSFRMEATNEKILNISYPLNNRELAFLKNRFNELDESIL